MKRRHFVGATSAGLAAALWPSWLRDAFGDGPVCTGITQSAVVAASFRAAHEAGKPLLVLVIPADDSAKWTRGEAFGELLNHGSDRDVAPLARAEVVCATMETLRKMVPTAGAGEPLMVLVSTDKVPATARQLDATLPEPGNRFDKEYWKDRDRKDDAFSDQRIAALSGLLRGALGADDARAPTLAADVRRRLKDAPPSGAKWARSYGCGVDVEGDPPMAMGCGMGHVPKKAQRFLYFFTRRA